MLEGVLTAVVTPFRDGAVDEAAFRNLVEAQVQAGVTGVVICGSTGEAATLSASERKAVVRLGIEICQGTGTQAWVGTGSNNTLASIESTQEAERLGASGAMIVAPFYNKPTQEGLYQHFAAIARESSVPLILYNVPGRTGVHVEAATVARVHELGRYVALKEASGSLDHVSDVRASCDMNVLSGDDSLTLPMLALGARGVISVVSNLFPAEVSQLVRSYLKGQLDEARDWHYQLLPFFRGAFIETNPAPIKMLLSLEGLCSAETRLPLVPATEAAKKKLATLLAQVAWREVPS